MELLSTANLGSIRQRQGGTGLPVNGRRRMHIRNQTENLTRSLPPLAAAAFYQELRLTSLILQDLRLRKLSSLVQSRLFKRSEERRVGKGVDLDSRRSIT